MIAEGIETAQERELLTAWGCRQGQGRYFAGPVGVADGTAMLRTGLVPSNART